MIHQLNNPVLTGKLFSKGARSQNVIYSGLLAVLAAYSQQASVVQIISCYLLIVLLYAVSTVFNNISDTYTDILNKRNDNPLVSNNLSRRELGGFFAITLAIIVLFQFLFNQPYTLIVTATYLLLAYIYSDRICNIKSRGLFATMLLSVCYGLLPLLLGLTQGSTEKNIDTHLCVIALISIAPILLAKDYKDLKGDILTNKRTPLVLYGHTVVRWMAIFLSLLCVAIYTLYAYQAGVYLPIVFFVSFTYVLLSAILHIKRGLLPRIYKTGLLISLLIMISSLLLV